MADISQISIKGTGYNLKDTAAYKKPTGGIPATDLAQAVLSKLTKVDGIESGAQKHIAPTSSEIVTALGFTPTDNLGTVTQIAVGEEDLYESVNGTIFLPAFLTAHLSLSNYATKTFVDNKFKDAFGINASGVSDLAAILSDNDYTTGILSVIAGKVDKNGTDRLMTADEGTKLSGIETGALVHKAPTSTEVKTALGTGTNNGTYLRKDGTWQTPLNDNTTYGLSVGTGSDANKIILTPSSGTANKITVPYASNAGTVNGKTVAENVPSGAKFTDTTYESKTAVSGGTDVSLVTTGEKYNWNNKYSKPSGGIPSTDLASSVKTSLGKADTALQSHQSKSDIGLGNVTNDAQVKRSEMGAANGVATLGSDGKVPSTLLPSYVDDVLEYNNKSSFPSSGESGKIYVDLNTNTSWRWSSTAYVLIKGDLALGETSSTAYRGDRGKTAYDHSQAAHARTDATKVEASSTNGKIKINGTETTVYTHPAPTSTEVKSALGTGTNDGTFLRKDGTWATPPILQYNEATTSNAGLMSSSDKTKLNGIESGAQVHKAPTSAEITSALGYTPYNATNPNGYTSNTGTVTQVKVGTTAYNPSSGIVSLPAYPTSLPANGGNAATVGGFTVGKNVPSDAVFTDNNTTYQFAQDGNTLKMGTNGGTKSAIYTPTFSAPVTSVAGKTGAVTLNSGDVGLGNVGNFKAVSTAASQGLTSTEKSNARANIGAGTSNFSGSYNDLTDKPTISGNLGTKVYVELNANLASVIATANTTYVISYNHTLSGTLNVPNGAILEFAGGCITGGTINNLYQVDYLGDACIFNGVTFTNSPVTLKLDWLMPSKDTSITTNTNVTSQLTTAFNCGIKRIDVTSKYYYYINLTVAITQADLDIIGDTNFATNVGYRTLSYMGPCIHTDQPITMIDFTVNVDPAGKTRKSLTIKGLRLYMHYNYEGVDYSTLSSYKDTPLLLIKNGNAGVHKEYIDVYIQGLDYHAKHIINQSGDYSTFADPLFTGIEFRPTNDNCQTFIHVNGIMNALYCGVKAMYLGTGTGGWMTDINTDFDSNALTYGLITDTSPVIFGGCHQPMLCRLEKDYTDGFIRVGNRTDVSVTITGTIWDLHASSDKDLYNSGGTKIGTTTVYNPIHVASGQISRFTSDNLPYSYYSTYGFNIEDTLKNSPMVPFIENVAMTHNYLARSYADNVPNSDSYIFTLAHTAGPDNIGNRFYKINISDISIQDANGNTYTEAQTFTNGSINSLFAPKAANMDGTNESYETWPRLKTTFATALTITFSMAATKYAANALSKGLLCAIGNKNASVSVTAVLNNNSTILLGQTINANRGYFVYSLEELDTCGYTISKLNFTVTVSAGKTFIPWIGIIASGIASGFSDGGYLGGTTTIQKAVLKQSDNSYRYKYLPNGKFTDVYITSSSYTKILEFTYVKTGSHLVVKYDGPKAKIFFDINPNNHTVNLTKASGLRVKYEVYSTDLNASTFTLVLYAKKTSLDVYLSALEISTTFNHVLLFENLSNGTLTNSGEFGEDETYSYSDIGYNINKASISGSVSNIDGSIPLHLLTVTGAVSSFALSTQPAYGHSCHVIFTATSLKSVTITHNSTYRICPDGAGPVTLTIPANGYVEVDFLNLGDSTNGDKVFVRGV